MKLSLARTNLAAIVAAAVPTDVGIIDHLPDSIAPPVCLIAWGDPWVKAETFCADVAAMEIIVVAQRLEPGGKLEVLEECVSAIVPAIKTAKGYVVVDVTAPYPIQIGGVDYLAASVNLNHDMEE